MRSRSSTRAALHLDVRLDAIRKGDSELQDTDLTAMRRWFVKEWAFDPGEQELYRAVAHKAACSPYDPLVEELDALPEWDGTHRLDVWLHVTTGCPDDALHRAYARCFLVSAVARAFAPGCKVDTVLLLVGPQGCLKSTLFRTLAGAAWFRDTELDLRSKDTYLQIARAWIYEVAEMSGFDRATLASVKQLISSSEDTFRSPYARTARTWPRRGVFVATANDRLPLRDLTGSRRFWPVLVRRPKIDVGWVVQNRTQLLAEAVASYDTGAPWWLPDDLDIERGEAAAAFTTEDPREVVVAKFLDGKGEVYLADVLEKALRIPRDRWGQAGPWAGEIMGRLGWMRRGKAWHKEG